ncbi:MAG: LPXTG cell wall anchor domain-containing protein [Ileibacterium sp.]|nr:LPXTG cell wall anchor domain-containing protein [Ileibacterium sp.]
MDNQVQKFMSQFLQKKAKRRRLMIGLVAASMVTMTAVSWNMHQNGESYAELYCGLEENHVHSDECYEKVLICDKQESSSATEKADATLDEHSETKADVNQKNNSGKAEAAKDELVSDKSSSEHHHTDACYEKKLICTKPVEHKHSLQCSSNPDAVEVEKDWKSAFQNEKLTDDYGVYLANIAKTQIGYRESGKNFKVETQDGLEKVKGYTRYGQWYENYLKELTKKSYEDNNQTVPENIDIPDHRYNDWDAMFVSFCLYYSGAVDLGFPVGATASDLYDRLNKIDENNEKAYEASKNEADESSKDGSSKTAPEKMVAAADDAEYTPKAGDIVFFDKDKNGIPDSTGLISEVGTKKDEDEGKEYKTIKVIEGNHAVSDIEENSVDGVSEDEYRFENLADNGFMAFGILPKSFSESLKKEEVKEEETVNPIEFAGDEAKEEVVKAILHSAEPRIAASSTTHADTVTLREVGSDPENTQINFFNYRVNENWNGSNEPKFRAPSWHNNDEYGTENTTWNEDIEYTGGKYKNSGINKNNVLKFGKPGADYYHPDTDEPYNSYTGNGNDAYLGIVKNKLNSNGYPELSNTVSSRGGSLEYLFNPQLFKHRSKAAANAENADRYAVPNTSGLLTVQDGYWQYDSNKNFAQLNESEENYGKIDLKNAKIQYSAENQPRENGQFFPFNDYDSVVSDINNTTNRRQLDHYFGMTMTTKFAQRFNGHTTPESNTPVTFEFSGDDDVWIFIDGVLVSDIGGIHQKVGVTIDFASGKVTHYKDYKPNGSCTQSRQTTLFNLFKAAGVSTEDFEGATFKNNTEHELKMFYMERGGTASNLKLKFNLIPTQPNYLYKTDQFGYPLEGAKFQVVGKDGNTYVSETGSDGRFTFNHFGTDKPMSLADMNKVFGDEFILEETKVPDGYRQIANQIPLRFVNGILESVDPYTTGVWAQTTAKVTSTETLYKAGGGHEVANPTNSSASQNSNTGTNPNNNNGWSWPTNWGQSWDNQNQNQNQSSTKQTRVTSNNGILFAVVLKRDGKGAKEFDSWDPVIGNDTDGYQKVGGGSSTLEKAITAFKITQASSENIQRYGDWKFSQPSGGVATLENLPGKISDYYTYRDQNKLGVDGAEYFVAYYYSEATSVADMNAGNTYRVMSHSSEGAANDFDILWGTRLEVPNIENQLMFQKVDSKGNRVKGPTVFALYNATDVNGEVAYVAKNGEKYVLNDDVDGDNKGTVKSVNGKTVSGLNYEINDDFDISDYKCLGGGLIDPKFRNESGAIFIKDANNGTVATIIPAQDGDENYLVGRTHEDCDEISDGTDEKSDITIGHFDVLMPGNYALREVKAPKGFKINSNVSKVVVNDEGVFANAGTKEDGITVYNGAGYLAHPLHQFASPNSTDETFAWITNDLHVNTDNSFGGADDIRRDSIFADNTGATTVRPIGENTVDVREVNKARDQKGLLRNYMTYHSDLSSFGGVMDYEVNTAREASDGVNSLVLGTDEGWSTLAMFQDEDYAETHHDKTTGYTKISEIMNDSDKNWDISHLYARTTLVEVTDVMEAKINLIKVDDSKQNYLEGAKFNLSTLIQKDGKAVKMYWNSETGAFDLDESQSEVAAVFETKTDDKNKDKKAYFELPMLEEGTYQMVETDAPTGYVGLTQPITIQIGATDHDNGADPVLKPGVESVPEVNISIGNTPVEVTKLTEQDVYYTNDGADYQYMFKVENSRTGVNIQVTKTDKDHNVLDGALFAVYKLENGTKYYFSKNSNYDEASAEAGLLYGWEKVEETLLDPETVNPEDENVKRILFTGTNFTIKGLTPGEYFLREVRSPEGFNPLSRDIKMTVAKQNGELVVTVDDATGFKKGNGLGDIEKVSGESSIPLYKFDVKNTSYRLPDTGGEYGNSYYILLGGIFVGISAGYALLTRKRKTI